MSWFTSSSAPLGEEPRKKTRQPITAAEFKRVLETTDRIEAPYPQRYLGMGSIIDLEDKAVMLQKVLEYWEPAARIFDYYSCSYLDQGTLKGDLLQDFLFKAGVTYCNTTGATKFKESQVILEEHGLKGYMDGVLDFHKMKALGHSKGPQPLKEDQETKWVIMEAKETGDRNYSSWGFPEDLPIKYRCQGSLYAYTLPRQIPELGTKFTDEVMFLIMNRESPRTIKTLFYKPEQELVDRCIKVADEFWGHIQNRTLPKAPSKNAKSYEEFSKLMATAPKEWEKHVEDCIEKQPRRKWVAASGLSSPQEQKELF